MDFNKLRREQIIRMSSTIELKLAVSQGLQELTLLVDNKPIDIEARIKLIEISLREIKEELIRRGELE